MLTDQRMSHKPLLVFANKQDQHGARTLQEIDTALQLTGTYRLVGCAALTDPVPADIDVALGWLLSTMIEHHPSLKDRVDRQTAEDNARRRTELEAKRKRVEEYRRVWEGEQATVVQMNGLLDEMLVESLHAKFQLIGVRPKATIVVLGLDGAGKTSIVSVLRGDTETYTHSPITTFECPQLELVVVDVPTTHDWHQYCHAAHGIIYVVDSSLVARYEEAMQRLWGVLGDHRAEGKPLLVLANKQDSPEAHPTPAVETAVRVSYVGTHLVLGCSALARPCDGNITEGVQWLVTQVNSNFDHLHRRVAS
eukprot:NODE_2321_length_1211_cov_37.313653_g2207_i0.p1 GENE.NODE_2321_length_1211_cov_37.313653_g2207_i0~~NODE_2321_length_1211_cov_37.313653_g2207_i0.p1  ORF type:complete len:308 (+),score=70.94 NODE_2321_length_1211_cov_37.313653_g2207_i0:187-1110(+)